MDPDSSKPAYSEKKREHDIASHIFSNSAVMLGLCLTIISIVHGESRAYQVKTVVDDIIALNALIFLAACFLSYAVLRSRHLHRMKRVESIADAVFLLGMTGMAVAAVMLVWTLM